MAGDSRGCGPLAVLVLRGTSSPSKQHLYHVYIWTLSFGDSLAVNNMHICI